ncbi:hypothetical protein PHYPSEUDO_008395 [Phytophthora pseudosyringae]|uniref:Uncharacterized protein n=1 Tax=Phytophthora pseudosyringae TaxID=221518 RepID=A0A8T1W9M5_9STRA|nr:hypothetical protein PHYPSEUDO_008395 [Phytophthora pseudosyringae]
MVSTKPSKIATVAFEKQRKMKLVSFRSDGVGVNTLRAVLTVLALSIVLDAATSTSYTQTESSLSAATKLNETHSNTTHYWAEDHPYTNQPHWTRLSDGKVVPNNASNFSSFAEYRGAVEAKAPWISKWVLSTEGRRTLKKDIPRLLMYNLVSPMDYGGSVRSGKVRRRRNKAIGMFLTDNLALPLLKSLGRVAWNLVQSHYVGYFEDEMFANRLAMMNASEMIQEFNLTLPVDAIEAAEDDESRPNTTLACVYDGEGKRAVLYAQYSAAFAPYEGYSNKYYTRDDTLPLPTFPADSYPWIWSPRLEVTRTIASQLLRALAVDDDELDAIDSSANVHDDQAKLGSCYSSCGEAERNELQRKLANLADGSSYISSNMLTPSNDSVPARATNESIPSDRTAMSSHDIQALEQIQAQLQDFHFDTGIPRFANRSNGSHSAFPSLTEFLQAVLATDVGANLSTASESSSSSTGSFGSSSEAGIFTVSSLHNDSGDNGAYTSNATDFSTRSEVYAALTHFYSYPSVDKWMVERDSNGNASVGGCTAQRPCLIQSGVTVYTPALTALTLFQTFADTSADPAMKRAARLKALQDMVEVAFEGERRVLDHGLQGPSTVWYSNHDLDVDEFADAVLSTVNISISGDPTPLHVFDKHMNERVAILDEVVSYYADTNHDTKVAMEVNFSIPLLDKLEDSELVELISLVESQMKSVDRSIASYVHTRAANPLYQEVVNATIRGDFYNGSEYTLVGFGFIIPATNAKNVLYRDMKLPVPFHLALRLMVRFQESRLLLPQESRQVLVCLAMAVYNISFYRCRPA